MPKDSTPAPVVNTTGAPTPDEWAAPIRVIAPKPDGFTILYNDAAHALLKEREAVARCYLALCLMSNGDRDCKPSLALIADYMGMDRSTAKRAAHRLEQIGLLAIVRPPNQGKGMPSQYHLTRPIERGASAPPLSGRGAAAPAKGGQPEGDKGGSSLTPTQVTNVNNKQVTGAATISDSQEEGTSKNATPNPAEKTPPDSAPPPIDITVSPCFRNAYWQHPQLGAHRMKAFQQIRAEYPVKDGEQLAAPAWQRVINTRLDVQTPESMALYRTISFAAQWYSRKCAGTLPGYSKEDRKWITPLVKWINGEEWNNAPDDVRAAARKA